MNKIKTLIGAKKWSRSGFIIYDEIDDSVCCTNTIEQAEKIIIAVNGFNGLVETIESQKQTFDALVKKYRALEEAAEKMAEALVWAEPFIADGLIGDKRFAYDKNFMKFQDALTQFNALKEQHNE